MEEPYLYWNEIPYAGEDTPPANAEEPLANSWNMFFFRLGRNGQLITRDGKSHYLNIRNPKTINWEKQLRIVHQTLEHLTPSQINIAHYWGTGVATKQWTPIIDRLIDTYGVSAARAARILACTQAAINDAFVMTWYYKYKWLVARPNQLDPHLETIVCTPRHPSYPSGHAAVAGCAEVMLSYFFPGEKHHLRKLAEECADSRLYAGVHFPIDNTEGLAIGRQMGELAIQQLKSQHNSDRAPIDTPYTKNLRAHLTPPPYPYEQAIPYEFNSHCQSKLAGTSLPPTTLPKPTLFF
jgi:hypothetical protein